MNVHICLSVGGERMGMYVRICPVDSAFLENLTIIIATQTFLRSVLSNQNCSCCY